MIKYRYIFMMCSLLFFTACDEMEVEKPDLVITPVSTTATVGQPVTFNIEGYADMIAFYSGEPGNEYSYKEGRVIDISGDSVRLVFSSAVTGGTQADQLTLLMSTDFDGNYESLASVKQATWVDITDRFVFGTTGTFANSTVQDLTDLLEPGKPVYFAYRYVTRPQAVNGLARTWMVQTFSLTSNELYKGAPLQIVDQANAGFRIVEEEPENAPARSTITTSRVSLLGNVYKDPADPIYDPANPIFDPANPIYDPTSHLYDPNVTRPDFVPYDPNSPYNDPELEHWAITKPISLEQVDLGPDWSRAIKGIANSEIEEYKYTYSQPGTYTAHFVVINATIEKREEVIKEFTITVTE